MLRATAAIGFILALAACSSPTPYRDLAARPPASSSPWERHENYELFTVEFDDQGWLAAADRDPALAASQLALLMDRLKELTEGPKPAPLSIVLYTHGWHHSAAPDDGNVVSIRKFLSDTAQVEEQLCLAKRGAPGVSIAGACREQASTFAC